LDKVKVTRFNHEVKFLGYKCFGRTFLKDELDFFKNALYVERSVENLDKSLSRLLAFYVLGGCNHVSFTHFFFYMAYAYGKLMFPVMFDEE